MAVSAANGVIPAGIEQKLAGLRRSVRLWLALDGAAVLCVALVLLALVSLVVDRYLRMDLTQRALSLLLGLGALGFLAWRRLARPLTRPLDDEVLGLLVEARHRELRERLISAIQFSRMADPEAVGSSAALVRATIDDGVRAAGEVDFADTVDRQRQRLNVAALALAAAIVVAACVAFPSTMRLWFARNVLLLDRSWPQATHLTIVGAADNAIVCPRGDDLTVEVQADPSGIVPSLVTIRFRQEGGSSGSEPMVVVGENTFSTTFRNVLEPLRFYVWGGDAETPWCYVHLVERPVVEALTLVCTPPEYVGRGPHPLPSDVGSCPVLLGSTLQVQGTASKPLRGGELAFGKARPIAFAVSGERGFQATLAGETLQSGTYAISLTDTDGYASRQPARFSLKVVPDQKPVVRARLEGIGDMVTPRAVVPVHARMSDDYAVVSAELVCVLSAEAGKEPVERRTPFGDRKEGYGQRQLAAAHRLDVSPLALSPGTHMALHVEARDNDAVSGPKVGLSGTFSLRVVTEDELRSELLRREQEQRLEFERILSDQQKLLENSRALEATLKRDPTLAARDRALLASSEKLQRLVGGRALAIAAQFTQILAEVENNRLEADPQIARDRLHGRIIEPLELLARRGVLQAADLLDVARKALPTADGSPLPATGAPKTESLAALADAVAEQDQLAKSMREILRHMVKWEGYQEAVNLLREVLKAQRNLNEETIREYQRRIQKIFE
ncbi:MAG TPA: hypothetical protein VNE39_27300 [Planctomycetota bacterium]|nr:hypothetical protein [Planctomycetota bacterium]